MTERMQYTVTVTHFLGGTTTYEVVELAQLKELLPKIRRKGRITRIGRIHCEVRPLSPDDLSFLFNL